MKRPLRPEEMKLWSLVARTVKPAPGRSVPRHVEQRPLDTGGSPMILPASAVAPHGPSPSAFPPDDIEPNRMRRIVRGRSPIEATIDLHGFDQDRAKAALCAFIGRAFADGHRAALVITGRGALGDGVLRRRAPEWLSAPELRSMVAGFSPAHQKHGGDGALYVALKRKS